MIRGIMTVSLAVLLMSSATTWGVVMVEDIKGTDGDQTDDLVTELNKCTGGAKVTKAGGKLAIEAGGNAYAGLVRDIIDSGTTITIKAGNNVPNVFVGAFQPGITSAADANTKKSNGTQLIDMDDVKNIATLAPGASPWGGLIHEMTECFRSTKDMLVFNDAHKTGIDAENVAYVLEGKGQRPQDTVVIPVRPVVPRPGGGYSVFEPYYDPTEGPGWLCWDLNSRFTEDGGTSTALLWGMFGDDSLPLDPLNFDYADIYLEDAKFVPIPEPASVALLLAGGWMASWRSRQRRQAARG